MLIVAAFAAAIAVGTALGIVAGMMIVWWRER